MVTTTTVREQRRRRGCRRGGRRLGRRFSATEESLSSRIVTSCASIIYKLTVSGFHLSSVWHIAYIWSNQGVNDIASPAKGLLRSRSFATTLRTRPKSVSALGLTLTTCVQDLCHSRRGQEDATRIHHYYSHIDL